MNTLILSVLGALLIAVLLHKGLRRLELSRAKHRSLAGHARWSRRFAKLVPFYEFDESQFFRADDAPDEVARSASCGLHAACVDLRTALSEERRADRGSGERRFGYAVHVALPRTVSVLALREEALQGRLVPAVVLRSYRSPISTVTNCTTSPARTASTFLDTTSTRAASSAAASW